MSEDYIRILEESLQKKVTLLERIIVRNEQQKQLFESDETTPEELDENVEAKGRMVDQIVELDEGFEQVFSRVEQLLSDNRDAYRDEIGRLQELVRKVTELAARVEAQEQRNYVLAGQFFSGKKKKAKNVRQGTMALDRYRQGMMGSNTFSPSIMDKRE